jgi:cytoskeletal protein RodZ
MHTDSGDTHQEFLPIRGLVFPVCLVLVAFVVWTGFQTSQLMRERVTLKAILTSQEAPVQEAAKLRTQLDSIARGTQELANQGNSNAKTIVAELQKRGLTINLPAAPAPAQK